MSAERIIEDAKELIRKLAPSDVDITGIDFEGPVVVIYTKDMDKFASNNDIVRQLAQGLRRRVAIRPDPSILADPDIVEKRLREIIPEEAQITDIYFDDDTGEVTIEAIAPGMVIGKHGSILNEIKKEIGWAPKVVRAPPIPSKTVSDIRNYLRQISDERKAFLKKVGRRLSRQRIEGETWIRTTGLGGYREVGRSATLLRRETRSSSTVVSIRPTVRRDPYFNAPELLPLDSIDGVVITHAHSDTARCFQHCTSMVMMGRYTAPHLPAT